MNLQILQKIGKGDNFHTKLITPLQIDYNVLLI